MLCHLQSVSSDHIVFNEYKKVILKLQQAVQYHPLESSIAKHGFCLYLQFLSDSIAQSSETSLLFPVYNLTATLLDCMQSHATHESLFAMIEQLQMVYTTVCWSVVLSQQLRQAG